MFDPTSVHLLLKAILAGLLAWAAWQDLTRLRIPNAASLAIAALFPAFAYSAPTAFPWMMALVIGAGMLALGVIAFNTGWIGGGDAKLLAATALWAGPERLLDFLFVTAIAGGALGVLALVSARLVGVSIGALGDGKLPYGVAIAAGGIAAIAVFPAFP